MRTSKFRPEQMVHILRQGESGVPVVEVCRQHGISEQTYCLYGRPSAPCGRSRRSRRTDARLRSAGSKGPTAPMSPATSLSMSAWESTRCPRGARRRPAPRAACPRTSKDPSSPWPSPPPSSAVFAGLKAARMRDGRSLFTRRRLRDFHHFRGHYQTLPTWSRSPLSRRPALRRRAGRPR